MRNWIKKTLFGLTGATLLIGGLGGCAHRGPHADRGGWSGDWSGERLSEMRGKAIERIGSKLDLDEAQRSKLGVLADELIAQRAAFRGAGDTRTEMKALIDGASFDRARAQAMLDQKMQAVQGNAPRVIAAMGDFYDSLNPTQQQQVREQLDKRHGWWRRG